MPGLLQRHAPAAQLHFVRQCQKGIRSEQPPDGSVDRELPLVRQRDQFPVLEGEYRRHGLGIAQQHFDERRPQGPIQGADPSGRRSHNSWNLGIKGKPADFVSLSAADAAAPRGADGSLPEYFGRLAPGSAFIDRGAPTETVRGDGFAREPIPYNGSAPDLGAYEYNQ